MDAIQNRTRVEIKTVGTGDIHKDELGSLACYLTLYQDKRSKFGEPFDYIIRDGRNWEKGSTKIGEYLVRSVSESSNLNEKINLSGKSDLFLIEKYPEDH